MIEPYTVALTSCERFDLLKRTLTSLLPRLEGPCEAIVIGEDSGNNRVFDVVDKFKETAPPIQIIVNRRRLGICRNIDRIYSRVKTDWIFHCEDDWEFFRSGFVSESFSVMKDDAISCVNLRDTADFAPGHWLPIGDSHYIVNADLPDQYRGCSFNPGLRRMSDYRTIGPYRRLVMDAREVDVSLAHVAAGKGMALLRHAAVRHIGPPERHVGDAVKSRTMSARLSRRVRSIGALIGIGPPLRKRLRRGDDSTVR